MHVDDYDRSRWEQERAKAEWPDGQTAVMASHRDAEPMAARRSLGKELVYHVELSQSLHEQIGELFDALRPMLTPEQAEACAEGRMIEDKPHSEMVSRADAHSRSLQEAVERLRELRARIEL